MKNQQKMNQRHNLIRRVLGVLYFWYGILKFFAAASPAEALVRETVEALSFGLLEGEICTYCVGVWEVIMGIMLLFRLFLKHTYRMVMLHLMLTFAPFVFLPNQMFNVFPFQLTMVGQYILKNTIFILVVWILLDNQREDAVSAAV